MIKTFIFVEDGSVDLDELKSSVGDDVLVIPYRQGATPPAIQQPREPVSRKEVNIKDRLLDLMIEFDEMGFAPTTVCEDPEGYAKKWKDQVLEEVKALKAENVALRERLDKAVELPFVPSDHHIEMWAAQIKESCVDQCATIVIPCYLYIKCEDKNAAVERLNELWQYADN